MPSGLVLNAESSAQIILRLDDPARAVRETIAEA